MASNQSEVSICNLALSHIGETTITALSDDTNQARECNRLYAVTRDIELRAHNWNFAMKRTSLSEDGDEPTWGYDHRYVLPTDCLRLVKVGYTANDWQGSGQGNWRVEGDNLADSGRVYLVINLAGPVYILYVARITDVAVFDMLFINALAARLAMDLAPRLTQSNAIVQQMQQSYEYWIGQARSMDAFESSARPRRISPWITSRSNGLRNEWIE